MTQQQTAQVVDLILASVVVDLQTGDKVELRGFGSFRRRARRPCQGRNHKTGDTVEVPVLDQSGVATIAPATVAAINARLAEVGYGGPAVETGVYANPIDMWHALAKVDHHLVGGGHLSFRYSSYAVNSRNARGAGGTSAPSGSAGLDNLDQSGAASGVWALNASTILEVRGQVARGDLQAPPTDPVGPSVSIPGVASFGRLSFSPTGRLSTLTQGIANLLHQSGGHTLRAGLDLVHNDVLITFPRALRGTYAFSSLANFLAGTYNNSGFTQTFGETSVGHLPGASRACVGGNRAFRPGL
jgi:hypothetical protein